MKVAPLYAWAPIAVALLLLLGCAQPAQPAASQPVATPGTTGSILTSSSPAAGSTVGGPVNGLVLHFSPPARLSEVTVTGPDGAMPMMVTAVGESASYTLPVSDLGPGGYRVTWEAAAQGRTYQGWFSFVVR